MGLVSESRFRSHENCSSPYITTRDVQSSKQSGFFCLIKYLKDFPITTIKMTSRESMGFRI